MCLPKASLFKLFVRRKLAERSLSIDLAAAVNSI